MAPSAARSFPSLARLTRRFAGQALLSGSVMLALNAASHIDLGLSDVAWPGFAEEAALNEARRSEMERSTPSPAPAPVPAPGAIGPAPSPTVTIASAPTPAPVREARLPVPARLFGASALAQAQAKPKPAPLRDAPSPRLAAFETAREEGVLLFDQCAPACESRDPLLHRAEPAKAPRRPAAPARTRLADLETPQGEIVAEAEMQGPVLSAPGPVEAEPGLLTRSLSAARETGRAAAGSLARLVSW